MENTKNYGGSGILICDEWLNSSKSFISWGLKNGYKKGLLIDRINPKKGYRPNNCRFVDRFVSAQNKVLIPINNTSGYRGVTKNHKKWKAVIMHKGKFNYLGTFKCKIVAAKEYDKFVIENNLETPTNFKYKKIKID